VVESIAEVHIVGVVGDPCCWLGVGSWGGARLMGVVFSSAMSFTNNDHPEAVGLPLDVPWQALFCRCRGT
jgi:hypothetical protein